MDEELQQLEAELKQLRPAPLPPQLLTAVADELYAPPGKRGTVFRSGWKLALPLGVAAAIVFLSVSRNDIEVSPASDTAAETVQPTLRPVAVEKLLVAAQDEGLVTLADGTPARRARLQYVDTITWRNPATNASLRWTVPREEVRVVPVHFQ